MTVTLTAGSCTATLEPDLGGRVASLRVDGLELLVTEADRPIDWGLYPMAPFAGRIRHGVIAFNGVEHRLPLTLPPHALHGTLVTREWTVQSDGAMTADLRDPWPYRGKVTHQVALTNDSLTMVLTVEAGEAMPAWVGWHPWFRRRLERGAKAALDFRPGAMFERDNEGIPTGRLVGPTPGPWDDCFTDVERAPSITWAGALTVDVESDCRYIVAFTEPAHAVCVEPQTAPPDAQNLGLASVAEPGAPLVATMALRWRRHG